MPDEPKPFILAFTHGTGSSWLWQELSVTHGLCLLGFEPLDDYCEGKTSLDKKIGWLRIAFSAPGGYDPSDKDMKWQRWAGKTVEHALHCRMNEVNGSFSGNRCHSTSTAAVGFKWRMTSGLNHQNKWSKLRKLLQEHEVRIIHLGRRNILQQVSPSLFPACAAYCPLAPLATLAFDCPTSRTTCALFILPLCDSVARRRCRRTTHTTWTRASSLCVPGSMRAMHRRRT